MKNSITIIYTTILSILFITVLFTIAELNIIVKTEFTNQLQQSVIMNASYLIICKLIIQIVITYIAGNILYHRIKYIHDSNINHAKAKVAWENYPEGMQHHKDGYKTITDIMRQERPLTPKEAFAPKDLKYDGVDYKLNATSQQPNMEVFDKVSELKFDPIDQIDELDKSSIGTTPITKTFKGKIKEVLNKVEVDDKLLEPKGILLEDLISNLSHKEYTFSNRQIKENKRWIQIYTITRLISVDYEVIVKDKKNNYYIEVK